MEVFNYLILKGNTTFFGEKGGGVEKFQNVGRYIRSISQSLLRSPLFNVK